MTKQLRHVCFLCGKKRFEVKMVKIFGNKKTSKHSHFDYESAGDYWTCEGCAMDAIKKLIDANSIDSSLIIGYR